MSFSKIEFLQLRQISGLEWLGILDSPCFLDSLPTLTYWLIFPYPQSREPFGDEPRTVVNQRDRRPRAEGHRRAA